MEPGSDLEEAGNSAVKLDASLGGHRNSAQELQERALPRPVPADDADHFALLDLE